MGEYAKHNGQDVKIGTCESMYYLRADQREELEGYGFDSETLGVIRFRFPFPDEDGTDPGHFEPYDRGVRIPGWSLPTELSGDEHHNVQFIARPAGYVLSIPCPEQFGQPGMSVELPNGLRVGRNGFTGGPVVRYQAFRGGRLVTIVSCGACGALHRLDTLEDAEPVAVAFRSEADRQEYRGHDFEPAHTEHTQRELHAIADRILAGYSVAVPA